MKSQKYIYLKYLQAKNQLLGDAHQCYSYDATENEKAAVDMERHVSCSPGYWCNWYQEHPNSQNKLTI